MISIVCVYNNERILKEDLLDSLENQTSEYELILMDNTRGKFKSATEALNQGGSKAKGKYIMFVHQDVHLCSKSWLETTEKLLDSIPDLGIAGTAGARKSESPRIVESVTNIKHGIPPMNVAGAVPLQEPTKVQTLDESLVIIPRPVFDMLQFDEKVCDSWHLYAADYSLSVARLGLGVHVIPAFIHHRSTGKFNENVWQVIRHMGYFPAGYYRTLGKLLKKHRSYTKYVYTCGWWSTSYPLILRRAEDVRHAVYRQIVRVVYYEFLGSLYYNLLRFLIKSRIVFKARNACKWLLCMVKHPPDSHE